VSNDPTTKRVHELLDAIIADYPRRKADAQKLIAEMGLEADLTFERSEAIPFDILPCFDGSDRPLSPMLQARFDFAGQLRFGQDVWVIPSQIEDLIQNPDLMANHSALRRHWDDSAPMQYGDAQLSVFSYTDGVPENLTYLVWPSNASEPEVWDYSGYQQHRSKHLADYLQYRLTRE
jgi:hypothetical protein